MNYNHLIPEPESIEFNGETYRVKKSIYAASSRLRFLELSKKMKEAKDNEAALIAANLELLEYLESFIDTDKRLLTDELIHPSLMPLRAGIASGLLSEISGQRGWVNQDDTKKKKRGRKKKNMT